MAFAAMLANCGGGDDGSTTTTLTWDAVADPDVAGYRVYVGTDSGTYAHPAVSVGDTVSYEATGLKQQTTYYFAVTAYDYMGRESAYSNEVSKRIE